jgi:hypothetical protein
MELVRRETSGYEGGWRLHANVSGSTNAMVDASNIYRNRNAREIGLMDGAPVKGEVIPSSCV